MDAEMRETYVHRFLSFLFYLQDPDERPTVEQVLAHPVFTGMQAASDSAAADAEESHLDDQQQHGTAQDASIAGMQSDGEPASGRKQWRIVRSHGAPRSPASRDPSSVHSSAAQSASNASAASVEALQAQYDALALEVNRASLHQQQRQPVTTNLELRQFQYVQQQIGGNASTVTTSTALVSYPHVSFPTSSVVPVPAQAASMENARREPMMPSAARSVVPVQQPNRQLQTIPESSRGAESPLPPPPAPAGNKQHREVDSSKQHVLNTSVLAAAGLPKPTQSSTEPNIVMRPTKRGSQHSPHLQQPPQHAMQSNHQPVNQPQPPRQVNMPSPITSIDDARLQLFRSPDASMRSSRSQPHIPAPGPSGSRSHYPATLNTSFLRGAEVGSSFASAATVSTARSQADSAGVYRPQQYANWHTQYAHDRFIRGLPVTGQAPSSSSRASHSKGLYDATSPAELAVENICADIWRDLESLPAILISTMGQDLLILSAKAGNAVPAQSRELVYVTHLTPRVPSPPSKNPASPAEAVPKLVRLVLSAAEPGRAVVGQVSAALRGEYERLLAEATVAAEGDRNLLVQELQSFPAYRSHSAGEGGSVVSGHSAGRDGSHRPGRSQHTGSKSAIKAVLRHSTYTSSTLSLFSQQGETRSYDMQNQAAAPPLVIAMLRQVYQLLSAAKSRLPTRVFYFPPEKDDVLAPHLRGYKCTFMSNTPFADVYVQWPDGAMLRFETSRGVLHIDLGPAVVPGMKWSGDVSAIEVGTSTSSSFSRGMLQGAIPPYFVPHAKVALRAYARCCAQEAGRGTDGDVVITSVQC
jgi:hypothetical protein